MSAPKIPARPMEYPYTFVSKLTHFPWKMHWEHANWRYKWIVIGYIASMPYFYYQYKALNGPANQQKLREVQAKNQKEVEEHKKHLH